MPFLLLLLGGLKSAVSFIGSWLFPRKQDRTLAHLREEMRAVARGTKKQRSR